MCLINININPNHNHNNHIRSIMFSTFPDFGGSFFVYGPLIAGFGFVSFVVGPPNICFAFAIFNFYSGVMNFFFYSGFAGGMTTTGCFLGDDFSSGFTTGSSFLILNYKQ